VTVNNNLSKIISFVTSKGFQIHPDALILIEKIQDNYFQIIEDILLKKKKRKEKSMVIISDDIKNFSKFPSYEISNEHNNFELLNSETSSITEQNNKYKYDNEMIKDKNFFSIKKDNLMKYKENIDENFKIIYDSNDKINSGEGVE
jgi:DNA polymerase II small subunit